MKTVIYVISVLMICFTLVATKNQEINEDRFIKLEAISDTVDINLLEESVTILTSRLDQFGLTSFSMKVDHDINQIVVRLPRNSNLKYIDQLLTVKGEFSFYETFTYEEILDHLGADNQLFELIAKDNIWRPWIGFAPAKDADQIIKYFDANRFDKVKLIGQLEFEEKCFCVYGLKLNSEGNPLLTKQHIERMSLKKSPSSEAYLLELQFDQDAIEIWRNATMRNVGKPIVMLLDNKIVFSPKVSAEISSGLCEISGNIDKKECEYLLSIINTKTLPVALQIVE